MDEATRYKEYLTTIFNTRLLFDTRKELAEYIGLPSLAKNSIEKIRSPFQRRAIYSELSKEYDELTDGLTSLDRIMETYQRTSSYYTEHLSKTLQKNFEEGLSNFIDQCYTDDVGDDYIDAAMLLLHALHILPTYNARSRDIEDFHILASRLKDFLAHYVSRNPMLVNMPMISMLFDRVERAENQGGIGCDSRAFLIHIAHIVLQRYHTYLNPRAMQRLTKKMYESGPQLDIAGYWKEKEGTVFWQVVSFEQNNSFLLYHWQFDSSSHTASYTRYTMQLVDGNTVCMLMAPWANAGIVAHDIPKDKPMTAWYEFDVDEYLQLLVSAKNF